MRLKAALVCILLVGAVGCASDEPSVTSDPATEAPTTSAQGGASGLPAEFEERLAAACEESIRLSLRADQEEDLSRELRLRSTQVVADALHAGDIPPEAQEMVDAYDIYFQESRRALEILDRSEPLEKRLKEARAAGDKAAAARAREALEEAVRESQAIFRRATEAYGRFLNYIREFGLTACSL